MITFTGLTWVQLLALLVSVVLPALVALVTQRMASPGLKAVVLAFLAALTGFLADLLDALSSARDLDLAGVAFAWVTAFVVAVATHYGLLKPTGVTGSNGAIATRVTGGVGRPIHRS